MKKLKILFPPTAAEHKPTAFSWWLDEAAAVGLDASISFFDDPDIGVPDFAIMRGYDSSLSRRLERQGVRVINTTHSMELCRSKIATARALKAAGISIPDSLPATNYHKAAEELGVPFVLKPDCGSQGRGVRLVKSKEDFTLSKDPCVAQAYVEASHGRDVRVWVIGGRAVAAVLRQSQRGALASNFSLGGTAHPIPLTPDIACIAENAAHALGLELAGIDLLLDGRGGFTVCEANGAAGFRTISHVNIPRLIMQYVNEQI